MKLCVIGNSHVSMLAAAQRAGACADLDLTFYASPGKDLVKADLNGTVLATEDAQLTRRLAALGTGPRVDLAGFDGVVFVGNTVSAFDAVRLANTRQVTDWPSGRRVVAGTEAAGHAPAKRPLLSGAACAGALAGRIRQKLAWQLASRLRATSRVPICVVPQPYPSEAVLENARRFLGFTRLTRRGDGAALAASLREAHRRAFSGLPDLRVVHQPDETVAHGFLTRQSHVRGATRLLGPNPQPQDDILHSGPEMGRLALEAIRREVREIQKSGKSDNIKSDI